MKISLLQYHNLTLAKKISKSLQIITHFHQQRTWYSKFDFFLRNLLAWQKSRSLVIGGPTAETKNVKCRTVQNVKNLVEMK